MKMATADDQKAPEFCPQMESIAVKDVATKVAREVETESSGSSEAETESPRSVGRWSQATVVSGFGGGGSSALKEHVHSQVLRVREEELCILVDDRAAKFCYDHLHDEDRLNQDLYRIRRRLNLVLVSRPILPCSPLSGKVSSVKAVQ